MGGAILGLVSALLCAAGLVGHAAGATGMLVEPGADVCALLLALALSLAAVSWGLRRAALVLAGAALIGVPLAWLGRTLAGFPSDPLTLLVLWAAAAGVLALSPETPERRATVIAGLLGLPAVASGGLGVAIQLAGHASRGLLLGMAPVAAAILVLAGLALILSAWGREPAEEAGPGWLPFMVTLVLVVAAVDLWLALSLQETGASVALLEAPSLGGLADAVLLGGGVLALLVGGSLHFARQARIQTLAARRELAERTRTEARLRETEATARALFDRASQGIARIALDGTLERCNPALCQLSGFAREELEGRPFLKFVAEEDVDYAAEAFVQVVGGRAPRHHFEIRFGRKDGGWYWGRGSLTLVCDESGAPCFAVGLIDDVTERLHHARRLEALNRQLESQNRELERFASVVAHDLQEPLLTVRLFAEHLEEGQADRLDDEGRDFLARIRRAGGHMQELIESLLALTRITSRASPFVDVDLVPLVREVLADLDRRLQEVQGEVVVGPLPTLRADPAQLRQLFQNLLGNALKFHRPGVPPRVRVESRQDRDADGALLHTITVADNGIGFDAADIDRMFEPLQRLDGARTYEGTGMGLAICRKIVERHGGRLTGLGRPGEGGTLLLTLPAGVASEERPPQDVRRGEPSVRV